MVTEPDAPQGAVGVGRPGGDLASPLARQADPQIQTLRLRERFRDHYLRRRDPIAEDRLIWRAQVFRQLVHLLPGEPVLELGAGEGRLTRSLYEVSRGENPITAVSFDRGPRKRRSWTQPIEYLRAKALPGALEGRRFSHVVAMDLLDQRNCTWLLQQIYERLEPGGHIVFFESNPWNVVLRANRAIGRVLGRPDPRSLLSRSQLYELMSEIGFIRIFAVFHDFLYAPLTPHLVWLLRGTSVVLENTPGLQTLAGGIVIHAQKPPRTAPRPRPRLSEHKQLHRSATVVIPCHNEEMNIRPLVDRLRAHFDDYLHEIIPVDDNSTDSTRQVLEALAREDPRVRPVFRRPPNGVGRALLDGYRASTGPYVLSMDCDFQHLLPEIRDLFDAVAAGCDVAVGSRFSRRSVLLNYPFQKIIANRGFHLLAQIAFLRRFRDLTNNLKLMTREVVEDLQLREPGFAVNAETGLQPVLMGYRVCEVPISWINRTPEMGTSSFRLARVGGGYWKVLLGLWRWKVFGDGPYADLARVHGRSRGRP